MVCFHPHPRKPHPAAPTLPPFSRVTVGPGVQLILTRASKGQPPTICAELRWQQHLREGGEDGNEWRRTEWESQKSCSGWGEASSSLPPFTFLFCFQFEIFITCMILFFSVPHWAKVWWKVWFQRSYCHDLLSVIPKHYQAVILGETTVCSTMFMSQSRGLASQIAKLFKNG